MKQLYEVRTFRPIRRPGLPFINRPTRLRLEMDEVEQYMEYGPVYRIFENTMREPERVTGNNLKELHGEETIITESDVIKNTSVETVEKQSKNLQEEGSFTTDNDSSSKDMVTSTSVSNTNTVFQNTKQWNNANKGKNNSYNQYKNNHKK